MTIIPPKRAKPLGFSPTNRNTQIGFSKGSITGIRIASRAFTCFMASEKKNVGCA